MQQFDKGRIDAPQGSQDALVFTPAPARVIPLFAYVLPYAIPVSVFFTDVSAAS
jgi:hypothetical protein